MQKERLMNEFSTTLNNFQSVQRNAASKERDSVQRARASSNIMAVCIKWYNRYTLVVYKMS